MQLTYSSEHAIGTPGMLADIGFKHTESMIADEAIPFGRGLMRTPGSATKIRLIGPNYSTLVASADLVASNSTVVTIGGVATAAVVYADSHAATMALLVAAIAGLSTVVKASLDTTNNKLIHIWTFAKVNDAAAVTLAGSSQPIWTNTASFNAADFYGIAQETKRLEGGLPNVDNAGVYPAMHYVNTLRRARVLVYFETAFNPDKDTLYVRYTASGANVVGNYRNDADTGKATSLAGLPIKVKTFLTGAGIGEIELSLP